MERPNVLGRLLALARGEVVADTLEAYRRAGSAVYDLLKQVEDRRIELKIQGLNPWTAPLAAQAEMLCTWNAFALQTLGDEFLEADYRSSPATVGFVPRITAEQALVFYSQVEAWLSRAHQAQSNSGYRLDVEVPTGLPSWVEVEPCPREHLEAMLAATQSMQAHAEAAVVTFQAETVPPEKQGAAQRLRQLLADATAKAEYAQRLWGRNAAPQDLHEQIERYAKDAIERYYNLGQLLAMPDLAERRQQPSTDRATPPVRMALPLPGQTGFDPWRLTDPGTRDRWKRDPEARRAIAVLWRNDPDPQRTLAIQAEIETALARGDIAYTTDRSGESLGPYYCCPWAPIFTVKRSVTIGERRLRPLEQFTYDVSAEGVLKGEDFKREILVRSFRTTSDVDYCNPEVGGDHDE